VVPKTQAEAVSIHDIYKSADWLERDASLPQGWRSIEIERLWLGGQPMSLSARHGARATITPLEDRPPEA